MNAFCFVSRRHALAALAFGLAALADAPAIAEGDIYVHAGANFKPVTIAVTPFAGEEGGDKISGVVASDFARSIFLLPLNPANFPEKIANPDAPPDMEAWKRSAAQFVLTGRVLHQDPGRDWSVAELAAHCHASRSVFAERFQATLGIPPLRYVTELRMRLASQWLTLERLPIEEVALRLGYTSQAAFSRAFKRITGQPPGASRQNLRSPA